MEQKFEDKYTRYEIARILGARSLQLAMDAPVLLKMSEQELDDLNFDVMRIAEKELESEIKTIEQELDSTSSLNVRAEARMLEYVNEIRAQNGVGNIKQVNELSQIAHASSSLSVEKGEIHNHEIGRKYDCSNVGGVRTTGVAEVLTQEEVPLLYQINPENVGERFIDSWMGSDTGHREALLNPSYALGGFGVDSDLTKQYASGVFCPIR